VDLTGWRDNHTMTLDERLEQGLSDVNFDTELPIVTGYAQCREGLVKRYARGYTEITMSRIAARLNPEEAIIHKEYHLSSADPRIVGVQKSVPIGRTNYDVADQLSNLGMEAIHPNAASVLRKKGIPLRVKHAFEPEHAGTLIDSEYCSDDPRVEIVAGRRGLMAVEVFDQEMTGELMARERSIIDVLDQFRVRSIGKDVNANSVTHFVSSNLRTVRRVTDELARRFPDATVETKKVAFVCAVGTDLDMPGLLARCATALGGAEIPILSASQPLRGVDVRFVVVEEDYERAVRALHDSIIDERKLVTVAA
jgi:aspartate kinase